MIRIAILAAGRSSRFGTNKLLQRWRGRPLLSYVLDSAIRTCPEQVFVVTGADESMITPICAEFAVETVFNPDFASGIGTSIAAAARGCEANADGMLLLLGDQPLVTATHLEELIELWDGNPDRICATRFSNTLGPPVLFGSAYFQQLAQMTGDRGARELIANSDQVVAADFAAAAIDIDELDDISRLDKFLPDSE